METITLPETFKLTVDYSKTMPEVERLRVYASAEAEQRGDKPLLDLTNSQTLDLMCELMKVAVIDAKMAEP